MKILDYIFLLLVISQISNVSYANEKSFSIKDGDVSLFQDYENVKVRLPAYMNIYDSLKREFDFKDVAFAYNPRKDGKRLAYNAGLFFGASALSIGILWSLPESVTNWDKDKILREGPFKKWKTNVTSGPVWDHDNFFLNYVSHPYGGAVYYMSARGSGFNKTQSFVYTAIMSTFVWEYGLEAVAEIPSWQDIIVTPVFGSIVGESFFILKGKIMQNHKRILNSKFLGVTTLLLIDPFNEVLNLLGYKTRNKEIIIQTSIIPLANPYSSTLPGWSLNVVF